MRGFAENLHYRLENEYLAEITRIKARFLSTTSADDRGDAVADKPIGNVDADYYGRDIAETQGTNVVAFIQWLDGVETSIRAVINAGLHMSEEMDSTDTDNAVNIDRFFEAPTFEDMDYLDPAGEHPGR
ncbi:hypothetical protein ACFQ3B_11855 [Stackebrandtia endophytica]|uniref:hypothetical protein n=1 Tax=Stackebrandtia endophytica TaxID=1496996 RepID=UPI0011542A55|nr:hypothetical protein [Stackebrandtia endophytica]